MKNRLPFFLIAIVSMFTFLGCEDVEKTETVKAFNISFDDLKMWYGSDLRLKKFEGAHSDNYVAFVDSTLQFSVGMEGRIGELVKSSFDTIEVSGFVYQKDRSARGGWVIELNDKDGKQLSWLIAEKDSFLNTVNEWKPFLVSLALSNETLKAKENNFKSYGWTRGGEIFFDDLKVTFK